MEFFNKIRIQLKIKNFFYAILCLAGSSLFVLCTISTGFSSKMEWRIGFRGSRSGIPIPNWLISCLCIFMVLALFVAACGCFVSFIKDIEFNKMLSVVVEMGDVDSFGLMLASMPKCKYAKGGDLRFNESIVFYLKGTEVTAISPANIRWIEAKIEGNKNSETHYVCVYHGNDVLKIKTKEKNVLFLLEEMKNMYGFYA